MTETPPRKPILEACRVSKRYSGVQALSDVSLAIHPGEVLAVVGENGAGKSTLMKILAGVIQPTSGQLLLSGQHVTFRDVQQAMDSRVALIHQELNLALNLDVGANISLGREPRQFGFLNRRSIAKRAEQYLGQLGMKVSPHARLSSLTIAQQQLVEIAKALSTDAQVVIMDEPTSSLSQQEADQLYDVIRQLRSQGRAVVYISHRLHEVTELADRVVVLRDGQFAGELEGSEIQRDQMVRMMVGRDVSQFYHRTPHPIGEVALEVRDLQVTKSSNNTISLSLHSGEIVGLAGLMGAGRTELLSTLFGITPPAGGKVRIAGRPVSLRSPVDAIKAGVALAPEDRRQSGLLLTSSVRRNLSLAVLRQSLRRYGFVHRRGEHHLCEQYTHQLGIKAASGGTIVRTLSGGNQQKVVLGKWLATQPRVLLLDEPTRGIDVGSKAEIYELMHELAAEGVAILFASSEMEEILGLADRVLVMHDGQISGELPRKGLSEESIMQYAVGGAPQHSPIEAASG